MRDLRVDECENMRITSHIAHTHNPRCSSSVCERERGVERERERKKLHQHGEMRVSERWDEKEGIQIL